DAVRVVVVALVEGDPVRLGHILHLLHVLGGRRVLQVAAQHRVVVVVRVVVPVVVAVRGRLLARRLLRVCRGDLRLVDRRGVLLGFRVVACARRGRSQGQNCRCGEGCLPPSRLHTWTHA